MEMLETRGLKNQEKTDLLLQFSTSKREHDPFRDRLNVILIFLQNSINPVLGLHSP
jgi:hypothetical protein